MTSILAITAFINTQKSHVCSMTEVDTVEDTVSHTRVQNMKRELCQIITLVAVVQELHSPELDNYHSN